MFGAIDNLWLFASGLLAGGTCLLHVFAGGPDAARPLLASQDLSATAKYTNYYCWHLVTITLAAMAVGLAWAGIDATQVAMGWMWAVIALLFALWSIALVIWTRQPPLRLPQWILFLAISAPAFVGLLA